MEITIVKYLKYVILILLSLFLLNCKKNERLNDNHNFPQEDIITNREMLSVSVLYYNYIFMSDSLIKPENIKEKIPNFNLGNKGILKSEIFDINILNKFKYLIDCVYNSGDTSVIDPRIVATISYSNGNIDVLCLGGVYSDRIYLNGIEKKRNNELLFLLKNSIGFYPWIIGDDLLNMVEIKDNSFPKEPFVASQYYKDYQIALSNR